METTGRAAQRADHRTFPALPALRRVEAGMNIPDPADLTLQTIRVRAEDH
ncbi:arginine 2-monooxygenase [Streptomyces sp. NPDC088719]